MKLDLLFVGVGGFAGAISRYLIYLWFNGRGWNSFPWATMLINLSGCLLIGLLSGLVEKEIPNYRQIFLLGSVGFLGAYTTFSTFGFETLSLIEKQGFVLAFANVTASVGLGLLAVWIGRWMVSI